ncbi:hypothetical protein EDB83DRAFT_2386989 [Lactarius deliciosus]|nr:hypothetical protein EDB83DRAFT_2386989 [Lactarius deliciosus]
MKTPKPSLCLSILYLPNRSLPCVLAIYLSLRLLTNTTSFIDSLCPLCRHTVPPHLARHRHAVPVSQSKRPTKNPQSPKSFKFCAACASCAGQFPIPS